MARARRAIPASEPITMPAIAPPLSLCPPSLPLEVSGVLVEVDVEVAVGVVKVMVAVMVGSFTPSHRFSALAL